MRNSEMMSWPAASVGCDSCVTVKAWPATVTVAERAAPAFGAAVNSTAPSPLPAAPEVTTSHGAELTAAQSQLAAASTAKPPAPPAEVKCAAEGESAKAQAVGAASAAATLRGDRA
jgi:hypothetical protein